MSKPVKVTDSDFKARVLDAAEPVVVDFWAPWCGPCRVIAPILDKLAGEYDGKLTIAKVNTDEDARYAGQLGIQGIPTLIVFKGGKEAARIVGARPEAAYREVFDKVLAAPAAAAPAAAAPAAAGAPTKPIAVTDADFQSKVLSASTPVIVDFWAPWCGPCRVIGPILDKLAGEYAGKLTIAKVNTDEDARYAGQLGIQGIPTLIIFKDGKEVGRMVGARPEAAYREAFNKVLAG